jgi:hypothetical protein
MKQLFFIVALTFSAPSLFGQLQYSTFEKICLEEETTSLLHLKYIDDMILAKTDYPGSIIAIDAKTGNQLWSKPHKVGYGIHSYGTDVIVSKNVNTYDEAAKKVTKREWLYTMDPRTGVMKDSILLKFSVVYLASSSGLTKHIPMIIQSPDDKFKSVLVDKKTGEIGFTLFSEVTGSNDIPNAIQVDPADRFAAVGCANGSKGFFLYDFKTGKQLLNLAGSGDIHNIAFTSDSKFCMYVQNKKLRIVNLVTLKLEKEIATENDAAHVAIHSDNENIVLSGYSVNVPLKLMNWKTGASTTVSALSVRGGVPVFTKEGYLYMPLQMGVQCKVAKDKLPYLAKVIFENSVGGTSTSVNSTTTSVTTPSSNPNSFNVGSRAYIYYSGDGKYYSGVISEITSNGYAVIYDDCSRATVKTNQVKILPVLKVGDKIQARRVDGKFYHGVIKEISGDAVKVEYSSGSEWVSMRDIMQVE